MALTQDWDRRLQHWTDSMATLFYEPLRAVPLEAHLTYEQLTVKEASAQTFKPMSPGAQWGAKWQYGWFKTQVTLPKEAKGQRIAFRSGAGSECAITVNGKAAGAWDREHKEITLTTKGIPGTAYTIMIEAYGGHGPMVVNGGPVPHDVERVPEPPKRQVTIVETTFGIWHEDVFQLWMDTMTLRGVRNALPQGSLRVQEIDRGLREMTVAVDLELPRDAMRKTIARGRRILRPLLACRNGSTAPTMYCFGQSHIDVAWLWPVRETEAKCVRTFGTQLALMDEYKDMTYLQSQPYLYQKVKDTYPKLYARIRKAVKTGRWLPEGGMWVEPDCIITSGESLVRQFIHGKRFFKDEFGVDNKLLFLPDVFGYSGALPQIMKGCGVDYFVTNKMFWVSGEGQPFPYNSFRWQGIDGTRVLAQQQGSNDVAPAELIGSWNNRRQDDMVSMLIPYGWGDGGGGATRETLEYLRRMKDLEGVPKVKLCQPLDYFRAEERRWNALPTYVGELYLQNHRGTYTSQAKTKKGNRLSEFSLRDAELWGATAKALVGFDYPLPQMDSLWKLTLLNQFHDILPGSSIARVHAEAEADHAKVIAAANGVALNACQALVDDDSSAVTLFNSLAFRRNAMVALPNGFKGAKSEDETALPSQVIDGVTHVRVTDLPSCGWRTLHKCAPGKQANSLKVSRTRLENEALRIVLNSRGELTSMYDKEHDRELLAGIGNQFLMYKDVPFNWDAWNIDRNYLESPVSLPSKAKVSVKAKGPLVASVRVERTLNDSMMTQEIRLEAGSRRVDFVTTIDWREKHKLLKVGFPVNLHNKNAIHEIQFGHLERPTHATTIADAAQFEVCQQKWTALCENSHGVALLNDSKYGIDVTDNRMNLTLLKSGQAPDMHADIGTQAFTYAFHVWDGSFADCDVVNQGYAFNIPVRSLPGVAGERSLFGVDASNVVIEAIKVAEDGSGDIVLRLYEAMRKRTRCVLTVDIPISQATCTNMLEEGGTKLTCRQGTIELAFRPFEIKTIRLITK